MSFLSDEQLRALFRNFEDPFVERKSEGDHRDFLKTAIAFANSLPNGVPGVMFVPAMDDGTIQRGANLDHLQRKISERLASAYPALVYFQRIVNIGEEQVIAVLVPGSPARPHFSGPAYVRDGSQTKNASAEQFQQLIARRTSKVEELSSWVGKRITVEFLAGGPTGPRLENTLYADLLECTQWYITLKYQDRQPRNRERESIALDRVQISFDQLNNWLSVEISR